MASDAEVAESIAGLSPEGFDALLRRTRNAGQRAIHQGAGLFLLAILLTASCAISLRVAVPRFIAWAQSVTDSMGDIFEAELETTPTRSIKPVIATITTIVEGKSRDDVLLDCDAHETDCPSVRLARGALQEVLQAVSQLVDSADLRCRDRSDAEFVGCVRGHIEEIVTLNSQTPVALSGLSSADLELIVLERLKRSDWQNQASLLVTDCKSLAIATTEAINGRAALLPSAGCDARASVSGIKTLLPQQIANDVPGPGGHKYTDRILASIVESRIFDHVIATIAPVVLMQPSIRCNAPAESESSGPPQSSTPRKSIEHDETPSLKNPCANAAGDGAGELVQTYYISPDSILRIWSPRISEERFPPNRLWSQGPYVFKLLNSEDDHVKTQVYVDTGGNGLVRTYCYPIEVPVQMRHADIAGNTVSHDAAPTRDRIFEGGVCFDVALRAGSVGIKKLLEQLDRNPLVESQLITIRLSQDNRVDGLSFASGEPIGAEILGLSSTELRSSLFEREDTEVGHYVTSHEVAGVPVVVIPIARQSNRAVAALVMRPRGLRPPKSLVISSVTASFSLLGTGIALFLLGASRRESELDGQVARLRSLPVGVVETDLRHNVIAANDRAEELVHRKLPKIGVSEHVPTVKFESLFEESVYLIETEGINPDNAKSVELRRISRDELRARRLAGARSQYYAKVKSPGIAHFPETWLRLVAIPLLPLSDVHTNATSRPVDGEFWMPAFGVLIECSDKELEAIRTQERRS
jgi:PAS domain-containing protein